MCRPFTTPDTPDEPVDGTLKDVGICTNACDPLAQDCAANFACDVTEDRAGVTPNRVFACLPQVEAREEYQACDGFPLGQCAPGLSCISGVTSDFANCLELCDSTAADACDGGDSCEVPDWFPPGTTVGVCMPD